MVSLSNAREPQASLPIAAAGAFPQVKCKSLWRLLRLSVLLSPTLFAVAYYGFLATDRYVSEAKFIIRTASKPIGSVGFGAFLQMAGLGRSQDDVYSVQEFLNSRDAARILRDDLPLGEIYSVPEADALARFPSLLYGQTLEELHHFLGWMVTTSYSNTTGITTLRVQAFRPEHAKLISDKLLLHSERLVNRMNARIRSDVVRTSQLELKRAEDRLVKAQIALTKFRNDEVMIDPAGSSLILAEVMGGLRQELTRVQTRLREALGAAPDGPLIRSLRNRVSAIETQIQHERRRFVGQGGGLASKITKYERLVLDIEFAKKLLAASFRALENAHNESRRQQLYLERVVEPIAADYPTAPRRTRMIATMFGYNLILLLVGWLIYSGIKERLEERPHD